MNNNISWFQRVRNWFGVKPTNKIVERKFEVRMKIYYQGTSNRALIGEMNIYVAARHSSEAERMAMEEFKRGLFVDTKTYRRY
jgi:hypothetical protein